MDTNDREMPNEIYLSTADGFLVLADDRRKQGRYTKYIRSDLAPAAQGDVAWLKPELPPYPHGTPVHQGELPRYGLKWNGPDQPLSVPMPDGYWTPWHIANAALKPTPEPHGAEIAEAVKIAQAWLDEEGKSEIPFKHTAEMQAVETLIQSVTRQQDGRVDALVKALEDNLKTFKAIEEGTSKHPNIRGIAPGLCNFIFGCTHEAIKFTEFSVQQVRRAFKGE